MMSEHAEPAAPVSGKRPGFFSRPFKPTTVLGWWVFGLGLATVLMGPGVFLIPQLARRLGAAGMPVRIPMGMASVLVEVVLAVATIAVAVPAFRRGERSWLTLLAFVPAVVVGGFWILFAAGEVFFPH